jgi:hypothetical protein
MPRRELALALALLAPVPASGEYRESGAVDAGGRRRTLVEGAALERIDVSIRALDVRVVVTGADGAIVGWSAGEPLSVVLPRAGEYAVTVEAAVGGTYELALSSRLPARPAAAGRWVAAGGGFGERGASVVAAGELALDRAVVSARGEVGDGWEATALFGLRPVVSNEDSPPEIQHNAVCLDAGCWSTANRVRFPPPRPTASRPIGVVAGGRIGRGGFSALTRVSAVLAGRWYHGSLDRASFSRDIIELGVVQLVSGRDRPFLRHASFTPGWYVLAQKQWGLVFGAEVGITGLAGRNASGRLEPELYARCHVRLPLDL